MYKMIVEMEGLSVEFQIVGKHCAQLLCHSNDGTRAVVVRPLEGGEGIYISVTICKLVHVKLSRRLMGMTHYDVGTVLKSRILAQISIGMLYHGLVVARGLPSA